MATYVSLTLKVLFDTLLAQYIVGRIEFIVTRIKN